MWSVTVFWKHRQKILPCWLLPIEVLYHKNVCIFHINRQGKTWLGGCITHFVVIPAWFMTILVTIQRNVMKVSDFAPQAVCLAPRCNLIKIRAEKVYLHTEEESVQHILVFIGWLECAETWIYCMHLYTNAIHIYASLLYCTNRFTLAELILISSWTIDW